MEPLGSVLLSSYKLSIVTIQLSVMVWPQFAMQLGFPIPSSIPKSPLPQEGLV